MTPYQIEIVLHFHYSPEPWPQADAPAFPQTLSGLIGDDLLSARAGPGCYETTPRGKVLVDMWCSTPLPEMRFIDPRFDN